MITVQKNSGDRIIELGGGDNPNPACEVNVDVRPGPRTHFTADFEEPLPIQSDEWDGVLSHFVIEHISWRKVRQFISEIFRILKPGGKAVIATANTEAQLKWIQENPGGWDGKDYFDSASGNLFGDNDYKENTHRCFFSPGIITQLFSEAGFTSVVVRPYGARATDMLVEAIKLKEQEQPVVQREADVPIVIPNVAVTKQEESLVRIELPPASELYGLEYFDGTGPFGGYAGGYRDYPCHEITASHVLTRKPDSVLELGCGRGYVLKRLEGSGILAYGYDVSRHAYMTRVAEPIRTVDLISSWAMGTPSLPLDLCFSISFLEHIAEDKLPAVIAEMKRACKRGLHGITFNSDGSDRTKVTLQPRNWWTKLFATHAPGWPVEIFEKSELERGPLPEHVLRGDGKIKLNIGSCTTMFHHGWTNLDVLDLAEFAMQNQYNYQRIDVRNGIPWGTGDVSMIYACHFLEHLSYRDGLSFLRECRRVLSPNNGLLRLIVPDAARLISGYTGTVCHNCNSLLTTSPPPLDITEFDAINVGCVEAPTDASKLWAMLMTGHQAIYDSETLQYHLNEAGFVVSPASFRRTECGQPGEQMLFETLDTLPCLSLYMDAIPKT